MKTRIGAIKDPMHRLALFVLERHQIYHRRFELGAKKPWTHDPILQAFRFCNVYRELDRVTIWVKKNWRVPNAKDPMLWFAMCEARLFNLPATLEVLGYPKRWNPEKVKDVLHIVAKKDNVFNAAYIVSTNGLSMDKVDYVVDRVLTPLWEQRARITSGFMGTLRKAHDTLVAYNGMGHFLTGQVIADVKNTKGQALAKAKDWWDWAVLGPGSKRGLNRAMGRDTHHSIQDKAALVELKTVQEVLNEEMEKAGFNRLCLQDTQNCLCEFDKYERALHDEGRPKQRYPGNK